MHFHCVWGTCTSDSRRPVEGVSFLPFPKPTKNFKQAKRWASLCGRGKHFSVKNINAYTYICSKHFEMDEVPSLKENPCLEPFNALKKTELSRTRARRQEAPVQPSPHKEFKSAKSSKIYERSMSNVEISSATGKL